jgi:hypothetical protein
VNPGPPVPSPPGIVVNERQLIEDLVDLLEDRVWDYEDNPPSSWCYTCGGGGRIEEDKKHKPDCRMDNTLKAAKAWLAAQEKNRPLAIRGHCMKCKAEISERDEYKSISCVDAELMAMAAGLHSWQFAGQLLCKKCMPKTCDCEDMTKREDWDSSMPACSCEGGCPCHDKPENTPVSSA